MRVAETRAVNRALRKAYGIGLCSVEELGAFSSTPRSAAVSSPSNGHSSSNGAGNGQPRLRDQLCLLIRQYNLDANLVKAYAADFAARRPSAAPVANWSSPSSPIFLRLRKRTAMRWSAN